MGDFDQFWVAYPRKVAKGAARTAWARALRRDPNLLTKCVAALAWQVDTNEWDDGPFTPHPSTYLNQERYDDERPVRSLERQQQAHAEMAETARLREARQAAWDARKRA